jgi:hypothetical protein
MTFDEFKEIRKKYNLLITFNDNIEAMSKEKYEELINNLIESIKDLYNDDSKKEQEKIEKELRKKQNASLRKLKRMVQNKKETDEFVKKLKEQEQ